VSEVCEHVDNAAAGRSLDVLDAGCGTGNYTLELVSRGHSVVGLDASGEMLSRARAKGEGTPAAVFRAHDLTRPLSFADGRFDAAVTTMVLYAIPEPERLVRELARVTKPGGILVAVTMCKRARVFGTVTEAYRRRGVGAALRTVRSLFGVGACNLVINMRQTTGAYQPLDEAGLARLLDANGWTTTHTRTTYTCDIASLAVARKD